MVFAIGYKGGGWSLGLFPWHWAISPLLHLIGTRTQKMLVLTPHRLLILSVPLLPGGAFTLKRRVDRQAVTITHYDPRMGTPELHLRIGPEVLRFDFVDGRWATEAEELYRMLSAPGG